MPNIQNDGKWQKSLLHMNFIAALHYFLTLVHTLHCIKNGVQECRTDRLKPRPIYRKMMRMKDCDKA